ncbi:MAG: hypothetical protein BYD32DRAFT_428030 [Podila humilis]|nr:MAG: hypothetical protein BYD32DRAFT_428030 [Podila humilis]
MGVCECACFLSVFALFTTKKKKKRTATTSVASATTYPTSLHSTPLCSLVVFLSTQERKPRSMPPFPFFFFFFSALLPIHPFEIIVRCLLSPAHLSF